MIISRAQWILKHHVMISGNSIDLGNIYFDYSLRWNLWMVILELNQLCGLVVDLVTTVTYVVAGFRGGRRGALTPRELRYGSEGFSGVSLYPEWISIKVSGD